MSAPIAEVFFQSRNNTDENRVRLPSGFGAAYGTAKSGVGIASMGVMRPELVMKSIVPVVMAGVLGIYGLIIAVIISTGSRCLSATSVYKGLSILILTDQLCVCQFVTIAYVHCAAVNQTSTQAYYLFDGYAHLAAGLSCGLAGLAAGMAIGIVGDAGVRQELNC